MRRERTQVCRKARLPRQGQEVRVHNLRRREGRTLREEPQGVYHNQEDRQEGRHAQADGSPRRRFRGVVDCEVICKRRSFARRKAVFCLTKGHLLQAKRRPFAKRWNTRRYETDK